MKRIIALYTVLLLGLTSLLATPNTLYFMEYLPYQSFMNPAMQPRCTTYVELPAISTISAYGNTGGLSLNDFLYVKDGKLVTFLHPEFGNKDAVYSKIMRSPGVDMEVDVSLFGFGFRLKEKGYLHINASLRTDVSAGLPKEIITLGMNGTPDTVNVNSYRVDVPVSVNAYLDLNGGYSRQINEKWTVGGRLHLLYGLANARLKSSDLTLNLSQQQWNISGGFRGNMSIPGLRFETDENGKIIGYNTSSSIEEFFKSLSYSIGASVDLGAVFKPIPELKISLSVKDLGFMYWKTNAMHLDGRFDYSFDGIDLSTSQNPEAEEPENDENTFDKVGTISATEGGYTTLMNGKIYAGVEYSFLENMMSVGVVSKTSYNYNHWDEELTVAYNLRPCSWFGLSASYSLISGRSSTVGLGFNLRLPPLSFYAVSDYTPVHYSADGIPYKASAFNVQAGLVLTMGCKKKKPVEETPEDVLPEPAPASAEVSAPVAEVPAEAQTEVAVEVSAPASAEVSEQ
jgi:hypothetical protein